MDDDIGVGLIGVCKMQWISKANNDDNNNNTTKHKLMVTKMKKVGRFEFVECNGFRNRTMIIKSSKNLT